MKLNRIEAAAVNSPLRRVHQRTREAQWFAGLSEGRLAGAHVLEIGCGRGVGAELLLDRLEAARVEAIDLDPAMIEKAQRRLHGREQEVHAAIGDAEDLALTSASVDAVVEFGVIHHVPDWQRSIDEIARVLRPGGLFVFEDIPRHTLDTWLFRTFTDHPRQNRFEADEFVDVLHSRRLEPVAATTQRFGGHLFVGAAVKAHGP